MKLLRAARASAARMPCRSIRASMAVRPVAMRRACRRSNSDSGGGSRLAGRRSAEGELRSGCVDTSGGVSTLSIRLADTCCSPCSLSEGPEGPCTRDFFRTGSKVRATASHSARSSRVSGRCCERGGRPGRLMAPVRKPGCTCAAETRKSSRHVESCLRAGPPRLPSRRRYPHAQDL